MRQKRIFWWLSLFLFLLPCLSHATFKSSLKLTQYYRATCADYMGKWQGFFTDPTDLFGNGGPWPVQADLDSQGSKVVGQISDLGAPAYVVDAMRGQFSADCSNGRLSNIFLNSIRHQGTKSQAGLLISHNVLVMKINYQNAMIGTGFWLFLQRVSTKNAKQ